MKMTNEEGQMRNGGHDEWWVYSTALTEGWIMLVCDKTGQTGTVRDPSKEEWAAAFHAPSEPYRWHDEARVIVDEQAPEMNSKSLQAEVLLKLVGKAEFEKRGDPALLFAPEGLTLANIEAPADAAESRDFAVVVKERRNLAAAIKEHVAAKRKERPILFSGPMVRAILSGRKTQTRRIAKFFDCDVAMQFDPRFENGWWKAAHEGYQCQCPFGKPGDRLWVRETHFESRKWRHAPMFAAAPDFIYRADYEYREELSSVIGCHHWKPSIFMKREASRITLEIVSVRVERLQEISEGDALAEGIFYHKPDGIHHSGYRYDELSPCHPTAVNAYSWLWESINGAASWAANPWVWVVEFKRI